MSDAVSTAVPELPARSVPELIAARAAERGDAVVATFGDAAYTYRELDRLTGNVAAWLQRRGVGRGDRVALLMVNSLEYLPLFFGIARAGAVAVPINAATVGEGLHYNLDHSGAVGVIVDADLLDRFDGLAALPQLRWRAVLGDAAAPDVPVTELLAPGTPEPTEIDPLDPMSIIYTSGTTGMPKGVVLSHASYLNTGRYFASHYRLGPDDVLHTCLPLFHCNAQQTTVMGALVCGGRIALNGKFSVSRFWSWIDGSGATITNLLGSMLTLLSKREPEPVERSTRLRFIAAAPVPETLHRPLEERFGVRICEGYGLTETGTMACKNPIDDIRPGTIGLPLDHNEVAVVDEHGNVQPPGVPGEIVTRSRVPGAYMTEYFREPEKTAEAWAGGWFHTGDVGMRREDGYFVFLDRLKDTIRRRGENISSFLVEKAITEHPDIVETVAVGVPSELSEEDVKVIVIRRPGTTITPDDVVAWARTKLADFMVPRYVEFREDLPRTETGRVHKYKLRREGAGAAWDREANP